MSSFFRNPAKKKQYWLVSVDIVLIFFSVFLAYWVRNSLIFDQKSIAWVFMEKISWMVGVAIAAQILALYFFELYDLNKPFYFFRTLTKISLAVGISVGLLSILAYFLFTYKIGRSVMVLQIPFAVSFLFIWRMIFERILKSLNNIDHILLIGEDESIDALMQELKDYPLKAFNVTRVWNNNFSNPENKIKGVSVFNKGKLTDIVKTNQINVVVFSLHSPLSSELVKEALELKYNGVAVYDMPTFYKKLTGKVPIFQVKDSWLLFSSGVRVFTQSSHYIKLKRAMDVSFSILGLIVFSPLLLLTAIAIKLDSKGPVFFKQERMGLDNREFTVIKFRTMVKDAEALTGPKWADKNDPRVTRVGNILRKTRIDELPQLFNVLKGEMSLVGPRPIRKYFEEQAASEIPFYYLRHSVKPGITGWAQTRYHDARSEEGPLNRFQYDLFYIQEASLFLDTLILLKTIQVVINKLSQ